jgi:hypothetical protein
MWNASLHSNLNFPAPVSVLGFLAAGCGLVLAVLGVLTAYFFRKPNLAGLLLKFMVVTGTIYGGLLFGFSFASHETTLAPGQEKYFCEIDCHLAYSIVDVKAAEQSGQVHYAVTLRTRFDAATISPQRPQDVPLTPNARAVYLVDWQGRQYAASRSSGKPLSTALIPGASYTTLLEFSVPKTAGDLRFLITTPYWTDRFQIGDENSLLHRKTYFQL